MPQGICERRTMKITVVRHGRFSPANRGKPTPRGLREVFKTALSLLTPSTIVACSNAPRTLVPAQRLCRQGGFSQPVVIPDFNPLETAKFPPLFGGWLYELLHNWRIFNQLVLILWWNGFHLFTEGPLEFLERIKRGLRLLQEQAGGKDVMLVCHQETIIVLKMILGGESPFRALRRRIPHFYTMEFKL